MTKATEKEISGKGRFFLQCIGIRVEAEVQGRIKIAAGQSPEQAAIEDQRNVIDGDIVEDIDPMEVIPLDKI